MMLNGFLDIVGDIDDGMIFEASQPWKMEQVKVKKWRRNAVAMIGFVLMATVCLWHTEVKAGLERITTWIGKILEITEDVSSYVEIKNLPVTQNGLTMTLQEVALDQNLLFFEISPQFANGEKTEDIEVISELTVNGKNVQIQNEVVTMNSLQVLPGKFVESFYVGDVVTENEDVEIELALTVNGVKDKKKYGIYTFNFSASGKTLDSSTVRVDVKKEIPMNDQSEITLDTFSVNALESTIYMSCKNLDTSAEYEVHGKDDRGNQIVYRLLTYDGSTAIFVKGSGTIAKDAKTVELEIYAKKYKGKIISYEEDDGIAAVDESIESEGKMERVSEKVSVQLK